MTNFRFQISGLVSRAACGRFVFAWAAVVCIVAAGPLFADTPDSAAEDSAVLQAESRRIAVIAKAAPSVLAVFAPNGKGGGSGVVISPDGFALTNYHVVKPCGKAMKCGMADGRLYDAVLVGIDPTGDVALIKLFGRDDFPYARLADSDNVRVGDEVFAMGNPFMLATDLQPSVSCGIISGTRRYQFPAGTLLEYADCFQTDAAVNPGNSGGPLFDDQARVIGINGRCSFEKRGRVSVGVGYAISINQIKKFLGYLHSGRIVDHATLGATVGFDGSGFDGGSFDEGGRVCIDDILEDSDAYRRGLRYGDEIVRFAGRAIDSPNALKNVLGTLPKGWRVPLSFRRDGRRHDILVRLAGVHSRSELLKKLKKKLRMPKQPKPKDGEKGDGNKPAVTVPKPPPLPQVVEKHFQKKHGYANYHFNLANRRRVLDAWAARTGMQDKSRQNEPWTINTRSRSGKKTTIELDDDGAVIRCGDTIHRWTAADELAADAASISLNPPGSGGLLATLYLWRRLAALGPGRFGEVYYVGTAPLYGHGEQADSKWADSKWADSKWADSKWADSKWADSKWADGELADVVAGLAGGVECRFYFDRKTHDLAAIEMFADDDLDPCEVYLDGYRTVDGNWLPGRITARTGDETFEIFSLDPPGALKKTAAHKKKTIKPCGDSKTFEIIRGAQAKVVKIQGAGGFRGFEAYQSGLLISPQGHVLTAFSSTLDTDVIDVTLDDGRRFTATLVGADPGPDVAVLKIEADGELPFFDLDKAATLAAGSSVLALSNLFGVAMGNEPVSVQRGVVAAKTRLTAGLGAFETPYHGPAYVLDASTNNPGAAGGALIGRHGRLAGMLGKELQNKLNRTWLNYAIPSDKLKKSADRIISGRFASEPRPGRKKASKPIALERLGIALVPDVLQRTPPYVDAVRPGSAAAKAGLQADDLIVLLGDRLVQSCKELEDELAYIPAESVLYVTVMRGRKLIELGVK